MVLYLIDILLKLRTTYFNTNTGEEFFNPNKILRLRLRDLSFYADLLAFIPFSKIFWVALTMDQRNFVTGIRMVKLYRIAIFTQMIQGLSVNKASKAVLKVLFLIFFLILFLHF